MPLHPTADGGTPSTRPRIAIVGSGPAGLSAADRLAELVPHARIILFEKRKAPARKLLIAGSSGLNVSNALSLDDFATHYTGPAGHWKRVLADHPPAAWLATLNELGSETFLGTSGRYFVREMKASKLLRAWIARLAERGVELRSAREFAGVESLGESRLRLRFADGDGDGDGDGETETFDSVLFALGGGSWEATVEPPEWIRAFTDHGIEVRPFRSANVGYNVAWSDAFRKEAEGLPIKDCVFRSALGEKRGELLITKYGLEGTPVYTFGETGPCAIDLKPTLTENEILVKLLAVRENLAPIRRAKKTLALGPAALALLYHYAPAKARDELPAFARLLKNFPLALGAPRPLTEAISSSGGIAYAEVDETLMLKKIPGAFVAGEMLDWSAPTGGFLIQGCVSEGAYAAARCAEYLGAEEPVRRFEARKRGV